MWRSKFFCVECFSDCKDAVEFVHHKVGHLSHPVNVPETVPEIEIKAENIIASEKTYFYAGLLTIGEFVNEDVHLMSKRYNEALWRLRPKDTEMTWKSADVGTCPSFIKSTPQTLETNKETPNTNTQGQYQQVPIFRNTF
jgi:hypothetical protein